MEVALAGEGWTDLAVMRRLVAEAGLRPGRVYWGEGRTGKQGLDRNIAGWAAGARVGSCPVFILRDLDDDAACAGVLRNRLCAAPPDMLVLRIAVREVEAWLMADRERLAKTLACSAAHIPTDPDTCADPKEALIRAARRSRSRRIREGVPPRPDSRRREGEIYAEALAAFAADGWRPDIAAGASASLCRARQALRTLAARM